MRRGKGEQGAPSWPSRGLVPKRHHLTDTSPPVFPAHDYSPLHLPALMLYKALVSVMRSECRLGIQFVEDESTVREQYLDVGSRCIGHAGNSTIPQHVHHRLIAAVAATLLVLFLYGCLHVTYLASASIARIRHLVQCAQVNCT